MEEMKLNLMREIKHLIENHFPDLDKVIEEKINNDHILFVYTEKDLFTSVTLNYITALLTAYGQNCWWIAETNESLYCKRVALCIKIEL